MSPQFCRPHDPFRGDGGYSVFRYLLLLPSGISVVGIESWARKLVELYPGQHQRDHYHDWREGLGLHQGREV